MEQSLAAQALSIMRFLGLGFALGLVYDLLRPSRYSTKTVWLWDGIFCALAAFAFFILNLRQASSGLWETVFLLLAFCLYIHLLSPLLLPKLLEIHRRMFDSIFSLIGRIKKICLFIKKVFSKT